MHVVTVLLKGGTLQNSVRSEYEIVYILKL